MDAAFEHNYQMVDQWEKIAKPQQDQVDLVFGGLMAAPALGFSAPLLAEGGLVATGLGYLNILATGNHVISASAPFTGATKPVLDILAGDGATTKLDLLNAGANLLSGGYNVGRSLLNLGAARSVAENVEILNQAGGVGSSRFLQTEGLGTHAAIADLQASGALPGDLGVVVTDRAVRFGDLHALSTLDGRSVEFALTSEKIDGVLVKKLYSGDQWSVAVPSDARLIGHVHPNEVPNQIWPSSADMNSLNGQYFRQLELNPNAVPKPSRIIWGSGNYDNTIFYPGFGKTPLPR